jgi:hypothetical protein
MWLPLIFKRQAILKKRGGVEAAEIKKITAPN